MKRKKRINIKKVILFLILPIMVIGAIVFFTVDKSVKEKNQEKAKIALKKDIKNHYSEYVVTSKQTKLYDKDENVIGEVGKGVTLSLEKIKNVSENDKYFLTKDFEDTYVIYHDVEPGEEVTYDDRYKKYIPFNENIVTNEKVTFYDEDGEIVYTLPKSYDLPIIIKDGERYGVEFKDRLLYVKKDDVKETKESSNTDRSNASGVAVLNYHFFYDPANPDDAGCNEIICASKSQFQSHIDYFKEHDIFTIKMHELELYMDGKLQLPKSVLITIDDGARTKLAVDMLTENKMNGTIFLVTAWYNPKEYYVTDYIELHSHSHNLHDGGECPGGQGGGIKCLDRDYILDDLKQTRELLNNTTAFCYPFYEYNSYSEELLKEAGFTMAFIGEEYAWYGPYKLAEVGGDKMKIPRFVVVTYTTISEFDRYFNEIR